MLKRAAITVLALYKRWVSPSLPPSCRYVPSCSEYAAEAVEVHGVARGLWLAARRLLRCHPLVKGGYDPVPERVPSGQAERSPTQLNPDHQPLATERRPLNTVIRERA